MVYQLGLVLLLHSVFDEIFLFALLCQVRDHQGSAAEVRLPLRKTHLRRRSLV